MVLCCATNRKVAGSIAAGVNGFFIDIKSFRSHYGPGVESASNRNEYQEYFLGVKAAGAKEWQPYHHPVPLSWNLGTLISWNPLGHSRPVTGLLYLFTMFVSDSVWSGISFTPSFFKTRQLARNVLRIKDMLVFLTQSEKAILLVPVPCGSK